MGSSLCRLLRAFEILIWGTTAIIVQLLCFKLADQFLSGLGERINKGELASAILLFAIKISVSLINAAAIVG